MVVKRHYGTIADVEEVGSGFKDFDGNQVIADTDTKANARLIAAAPELLKVVEEIVKRYFVDRGFYDVSHEDLAVEARAAIAKAKGEDP